MERLQKIIARSSGLSRRQAEEAIAQGKVMLNGKKVTDMGVKADPTKDIISVRGKKISQQTRLQYLVLNKPRGCVVTRDDPEGRKTIYDYLPKVYHQLKPVGRLDYDSQGLVLLTNDGELAQKMTHPRFHVSKTYHVKVTLLPSERQLDRLREGVEIDGRRTQTAQIKIIDENPKSTWLEFVLEEGRNRQIRKMCEKVGLTVKTLIRVSMGSLSLQGLALRKWKLLSSTPIMNQKTEVVNKRRVVSL